MPVFNAFLPCRSGSERVKKKNTREFCGIEGGLTRIKLQQLARVPELASIIVSTNDPDVVDIARVVAAETGVAIDIIERPQHLGTSQTRTDDLILYAAEIAPEGVLLWTHTTSPFCRAELYSRAIHAYTAALSGGAHDSLMSVSPIRSFVWTADGPLNYDRTKEKWPRTQTLPILYDVNSALFVCDRDLMRQHGDRIGAKPVLFEMDHVDFLEIDWEEDFAFAEKVGEVMVREGAQVVVSEELALPADAPAPTGGAAAVTAVTAVTGVVRDGGILVELAADEALTQPVEVHLVVNGAVAGSVTLHPSAGAPAAASIAVPLAAMPDLLDGIDVVVEADGVRSPAGRCPGFLLHRTLVRTVDEFESNVMRKHIRVRDRETVCYAARQALRRFPDDLRTRAVSLAVIGYRIAENPDGANDALLTELTAAADAILAGIDGSLAAEARWSSSLNVMMFNVFATLRQPERACRYLLQLFADRRLVHVEPMCAFNCMIGLVALGHVYRLQRRPEEAVAVWDQAAEVFAVSAYRMPKTFGAFYEFEFIQQCATFCVAGAAQLGGVRDKRMRAYSDLDVAALCLRASTRKGVNRTAQFFTDMKSRPELLPAAAAVVAYDYRQGEAR